MGKLYVQNIDALGSLFINGGRVTFHRFFILTYFLTVPIWIPKFEHRA